MEGRLDEAAAASKGALVLAGELGHVKLEYNILCNLGFIQERLAHPEEAQAHFEAAVQLANALRDSRSEGHYLGHLGLLHARLGRQNDAQRCLASGESLLRAASDPLGLGLLLTSRGEAYHLAGDEDGCGNLLGGSSRHRCRPERRACIRPRHGAGAGSNVNRTMEGDSALIFKRIKRKRRQRHRSAL